MTIAFGREFDDSSEESIDDSSEGSINGKKSVDAKFKEFTSNLNAVCPLLENNVNIPTIDRIYICIQNSIKFSYHPLENGRGLLYKVQHKKNSNE